MGSKKTIEKELLDIKKHLKELSEVSGKSREIDGEVDKNNETSSNLLTLLNYMINENKKTTMLLKNIAEGLYKIEAELNAPIEETETEGQYAPPTIENKAVKETPLSEADTKIVQAVQLSPHSMACAEDIRKKMSYKGKNAASARLNRLYKSGILERYQLGKKVYYKYDAGKTTNILIVSPPQ